MRIHTVCWLCPALLLTAAGLPLTTASAAPNAVAAEPTDAKEILEAARKSIADLHAFSYTLESVEDGGDGKAAKYTGAITAARADAGGWKLYAAGEIVGEESVPFEIAYDGVSARSIKQADKVVFERTLEKVDELAVFFSGQNARHPVAWELLDDTPFASAEGATVEGSEVIDETRCDKVMIPAKAPGDGAIKEVGTRIYFSRADHLPRKIERVRSVKGEKSDTTITRVLTMREVRTDGDAVGRPFSLNTPDGFRVRADTSGGGNKLVKRGNGDKSKPAPAEQDSGLLAKDSQAPDWTLKDGGGTEVTLSSLRGSVVVLDFWATWCPPCRAAMPHVQKLHEKYESKGVKVFGVNTWERGDAKKFMEEKKFTYGLLLKGDKVAEQYKVKGIPTFYVIDKEGKIAFSAIGMPDEAKLNEIIDAATAK